MKKCFLFVLPLLLAAAAPASAFVSDSLTIDIFENGDSRVEFQYTLSWLERLAVFLQVVDPAAELKKALKGYSGRAIQVEAVTGNTAAFVVPGFARRKARRGTITYRTRRINFSFAEKLLQKYWFAPLVKADLSPAVTVVRFPDGQEKTIFDSIFLPVITHSMEKKLRRSSVPEKTGRQPVCRL